MKSLSVINALLSMCWKVIKPAIQWLLLPRIKSIYYKHLKFSIGYDIERLAIPLLIGWDKNMFGAYVLCCHFSIIWDLYD